MTEGWYLLLKNAKNYRSHHHLSLQLELPVQGNNAKPPYLAVWLSKKGETQPRAQLALWGEQPRWYQELRSWWRQFGLQHQEQLQHWAGATRRAGLYQLRWNGRIYKACLWYPVITFYISRLPVKAAAGKSCYCQCTGRNHIPLSISKASCKVNTSLVRSAGNYTQRYHKTTQIRGQTFRLRSKPQKHYPTT